MFVGVPALAGDAEKARKHAPITATARSGAHQRVRCGERLRITWARLSCVFTDVDTISPLFLPHCGASQSIPIDYSAPHRTDLPPDRGIRAKSHERAGACA